MKLGIILLSKISQTQKDKHHIFSPVLKYTHTELKVDVISFTMDFMLPSLNYSCYGIFNMLFSIHLIIFAMNPILYDINIFTPTFKKILSTCASIYI